MEPFCCAKLPFWCIWAGMLSVGMPQPWNMMHPLVLCMGPGAMVEAAQPRLTVYACAMQAQLLSVCLQTQLCASVLQAVTQAGEACSAAMCALGGCISYLRQLLLDRWGLPSACACTCVCLSLAYTCSTCPVAAPAT